MEAEAAEKIDSILKNLEKLNISVLNLQENSNVAAARIQNLEKTIIEHKVKSDANTEPVHENNDNDEHVNHDGHDNETELGHSSDKYSIPNQEESTGQSSDITVDPQSEFGAIKEAVARIKLPADLRLQEQKQGIRKDDQQTLNVMSRSARYVETTIKLLGTITPGKPLPVDAYNDLYAVQLANIRYLQDEYSALVVQNKFNKQTAQLFRSLQKNTSGLNERSLETLKLASSITASASPNVQASSASGGSSADFNWRDRRRGGASSFRGGRGYRGYRGGDMYQHFATRNIPSQRPQHFDDQTQ